MAKSILVHISPEKLALLISNEIKAEIFKFNSSTKVKYLSSNDKPHLSRKETAKFFGISLNCINDWSKKGILKPIKVGQRTYFRKNDLLEIFLNKE